MGKLCTRKPINQYHSLSLIAIAPSATCEAEALRGGGAPRGCRGPRVQQRQRGGAIGIDLRGSVAMRFASAIAAFCLNSSDWRHGGHPRAGKTQNGGFRVFLGGHVGARLRGMETCFSSNGFGCTVGERLRGMVPTDFSCNGFGCTVDDEDAVEDASGGVKAFAIDMIACVSGEILLVWDVAS